MPTGKGESYWDNIAAQQQVEAEQATYKDQFGRLRFPGGTLEEPITIDGRKYVQSQYDWKTLGGMYGDIINKIGATENDMRYDPRYGNLIAEDVQNKFAQTYGDTHNDDGFFSDNGAFGAFSKTIGAAMGASNLLGSGLGALAAGGGEFAGTAASFLPEGGYQSLASSLGQHAAGAGGSLSDVANTFGGSGSTLPDSYWNMMADSGQTITDAGSELGDFGQGFDVPGAQGELDNFMDMKGSIQNPTSTLGAFLPGAVAGGGLGLTAARLAGSNAEDAARDMEGSSQGPGADPSQLNAANTAANGPLSRILNGTGTADDYARLLGPIAASGLGAFGATQQADAYRDVADKYFGMGQPYRDRLNASYAPGFSMANEPGYQEAIDQSGKSVLRGLSTQGNPFDNPGVLSEAQKYVTNTTALPQLNTYRSQLGTFGQLGVNTAGTADMQGANTSGGALNAIGYGLSNALAPKDDLTALLNKTGFGLNTRGWGYPS